MGFCGFRLRQKKKGQAMVEMLLLMALLVPLLTYAVNTVRGTLGKTLSGFFTDEIRTQVRYGYSYRGVMDGTGGISNKDALSNTSGSMPITMSLGADTLHPVQKVQAGWSQ